jgi:hypothetical protein
MKLGRLRIEWVKDHKKLMENELPKEVNWLEVARRMEGTTRWVAASDLFGSTAKKERKYGF